MVLSRLGSLWIQTSVPHTEHAHFSTILISSGIIRYGDKTEVDGYLVADNVSFAGYNFQAVIGGVELEVPFF